MVTSILRIGPGIPSGEVEHDKQIHIYVCMTSRQISIILVVSTISVVSNTPQSTS